MPVTTRGHPANKSDFELKYVYVTNQFIFVKKEKSEKNPFAHQTEN